MSDEALKVPKSSGGDIGQAALRAITGCLPIAGPAAVELVNLFLTPPLELRRNEWMQNVADILVQLQAIRKIDLDKLQKNAAFIDVVMQATQIALRNHEEEKHKALRNAIANSAEPDAPEQSKRQMFLYFIDVFTVWHLKMLGFFKDPKVWLASYSKSLPSAGVGMPLSEAIEIAFPELHGEKDFYDQVWSALRQQGLVVSSPPPGIITFQSPALGKQTTLLGDEFLSFINSPQMSGGSLRGQ